MMHDKALKLGLTLTMLASTTSLSVESKDGPAPQSAAQTNPADPILELQNHNSAFSLLIEAFREVQGRIIQNDYEARIKASNALDDLKTRRDDSQAVALDIPVHIDTGQAAKTLMDYVFIAPTTPDKDGGVKTT